MNTSYIKLSSSNTAYTKIESFLNLTDITTLNVNLSGVSESMLPCFLNITWGDGSSEFLENDIMLNKFSPIGRYSSVLLNEYQHVYYPSSTSTTKTLTAVFSIKYCNNHISTFTLPISVVNGNYTDTINDMKLINTVSRSNKKIHQFVSKNGGYLIEMETPFN